MAEHDVIGKSPAELVASVRLPAERVAADAVALDYLYAKTHFVPEDPAQQRRVLLSRALLLTETMAPTRDVLAGIAQHVRDELVRTRVACLVSADRDAPVSSRPSNPLQRRR
jgi:hypothetical protein